MAFIVVVLGLAPETRVALFLTPIWFIVLLVSYHHLVVKKRAKQQK